MDILLGVLFAGIVIVTAWGALAIPRDARFGFAIGVPPSLTGTLGKFAGLSVYLLIGTVLYFGATTAPLRVAWMDWVVSALLLFFLASQFFTVRRLAERRSA